MNWPFSLDTSPERTYDSSSTIKAASPIHINRIKISAATRIKTILNLFLRGGSEGRTVSYRGEGEAAAIFAKLAAEARGELEVLAKKGEGLRQIVQACGGSKEAFQMLMLEHMDHLAETSAKAISNIKFDKVAVWENGGANSKSSVASFLSNMAHALPPILQTMKNIGGVDMPEFFAKLRSKDENSNQMTARPMDDDGA